MSFQLRNPLSIRIGARHRRDLGDLQELAESINKVGLLHPIVVTSDGDLIAGERRLRAWQIVKPGEPIPAHVIDLGNIIEGEFAENALRKDLTLSEAVAIKRALEPAMRTEAEQRMRAGIPSENFARGRALDKVASFTGVSRPTLAKAAAVVDAAEAEPEKYARLLKDMNRTGRADGVWRRLANMQHAERIRAEPPPLPRGPYRVIIVDPPWPFEPLRQAHSSRGLTPYPTMTLEEIRRLPVPEIAEEDAILWLWTPVFHLGEGIAREVLDSWGFKPRSILTWVKPHFGTGAWLRNQTEHCFLATRGDPVTTLGNQSTALIAGSTTHSAKPEAFYELVESLCPAPRYLELFARRTRPGWDVWGDEVPVLETAE